MKPILYKKVPGSTQVTIYSQEPLWIDYGVFPRLPATGEDIYCDSLAFHFGQGYELARRLKNKGISTRWFLDYSEPVFQALIYQQAAKDDLGESIVAALQTFKTSLAVTAPLQSGEKKYILVQPPREMDVAQMMSSIPKDSWLVIWGWQSGKNLKQILQHCQLCSIKLCLGVPIHPQVSFQFSELTSIILQHPIIECLALYTPPYLPLHSLTSITESLDELKASCHVILLADTSSFHIYNGEDISFNQKKNRDFSDTLINWLSSFIQSRISGSNISASNAYAQSILDSIPDQF